jgi:hypothetical protein
MLTDRFPLSSAIIKRRLRPIDMCVHKPDRVLLLLSCCFLLAFFGVRFFAVFFRYVEKYRMYMSNIAVLHTTYDVLQLAFAETTQVYRGTNLQYDVNYSPTNNSYCLRNKTDVVSYSPSFRNEEIS